MTDIDTTGGLSADTSGDTSGDTRGAGKKGQAKAAIGQAGHALKQEAQTFASAAQERARTEAQKRTQTATKTLGDFANAVRRAGDELAQADQSPAARLIGQAADGLEKLTRNLEDKQPEELLDAVRDFGRRHPAAFIGGAVLAGIALGRFVRASESATGLTSDYAGDLSDTAGETTYPPAETSTYAAGPAATADETLGLSGGLSGGMTGASGVDAEVETPGLVPSDVEDQTSVLGVDEDAPERRGT